MKRLKYILLVGLLLSNLTAWGQYDPPNPPEPAGSLRISLVAEPAEAGYFNKTVRSFLFPPVLIILWGVRMLL